MQKEFGKVVVGRRRRPSVYSASIPRALQLIMQRRPSSVCRHSSQSAPGGAQRHAGNTSTHKHTQAVLVKNTQALNHERCNGRGREGLSVSVCTGRGHSRGHGRCQGGRGWIIAAPPLSSLFVASLRRERPSLPIRRLGFCLRFMSVACLLHQA